jgi:hypothetical protein
MGKIITSNREKNGSTIAIAIKGHAWKTPDETMMIPASQA